MVTHTLAAARRESSDLDAEVLGEALETAVVALADGPELPAAVVAVELAERHRGLGGGVLGEVEARELHVAVHLDEADVGVADLAEVLLAVLGVVDGHRDDDLVDVRRQAGQVDLDLLVVALALAGEVVTVVLDVAARRLEVVVVDEVGVRGDLAGGVQQERGGVQVEVDTGGRTRVPAEADADVGEAVLRERVGELGELLRGRGVGRVRGLLLDDALLEGNVAALAERNTHYGCIPFRDSEAPLVGVSGEVEHTVAGCCGTKRDFTDCLLVCQVNFTTKHKRD